MTPSYNDGYLADDRDPVDAGSQEFEWDALYERLGERSEDASSDPRQAEAIRRLLSQLLVDAMARRINPKTLGLRLVATAWVVDPGLFEGSPSLRTLAARCGVTPSALARHTGAISRLLGCRNRAQRHAWNWQNCERSTLA